MKTKVTTKMKIGKKIAQKVFFNKRMFLSLVALIIISSVSYGLLINKIVWNVVARQKAQSSVAALSSKISTLESSYIALSNSITLEKAHELGFTNVKDSSVTYVSRKNSSTLLSMRTAQ